MKEKVQTKIKNIQAAIDSTRAKIELLKKQESDLKFDLQVQQLKLEKLQSGEPKG